MLDVADEMGLMVIDETAIRGSNNTQDFVAGHDNMVNHARAPGAARPQPPRGHPLEPGQRADRQHLRLRAFEQDLYAAINGNDGTRPISVEGRRRIAEPLPGHDAGQLQPSSPHYLDGFGHYGEQLSIRDRLPLGEGEYIWPACSTKQGFEWFATATAAKRGKDASDLRPYTLLSGWAGFVPGVKTTDFTPEEGRPPALRRGQPPDPWSNPQIQRIQAAFNPIARDRPALLVRLRGLGRQRRLPAPPGGARLFRTAAR